MLYLPLEKNLVDSFSSVTTRQIRNFFAVEQVPTLTWTHPGETHQYLKGDHDTPRTCFKHQKKPIRDIISWNITVLFMLHHGTVPQFQPSTWYIQDTKHKHEFLALNPIRPKSLIIWSSFSRLSHITTVHSSIYFVDFPIKTGGSFHSF